MNKPAATPRLAWTRLLSGVYFADACGVLTEVVKLDKPSGYSIRIGNEVLDRRPTLAEAKARATTLAVEAVRSRVAQNRP